MFYVTSSNNVKIAVYEMNPLGKETVFLVHGWPLSHAMYEYQEELLVSHNYHVVSIDLRGFGKSDAPAGPYDYDQMADDIYTVVRSLKLTSFILTGFSMGGAIVTRYMGKYKGYGVSKLLLLAAAAPCFTRRPGFPYGVTKDSVDQLIELAATDRPKFCENFSNQLLASPHSDASRRWFELISLTANNHATIETGFALREEDCRKDMASIRVPTGIFHGEKDIIVPYQLGQVQHKMINGSKMYTFKNSGHGIFFDELAKFNKAFLDFIIL